MLNKRTRLCLNRLEDRTVPASISFVGGNLTLTGDPTHTNINVLATADNTLKVTGLGALPSTYVVTGNLAINGSNLADNVTIDLAGFTFGGNVNVSTGNSNDAVNLQGLAAGTIQGSVTGQTGHGNDLVFFTAITIQGYVSLDTSIGNDSVLLSAASGTKFNNNVTITNANFVASDIPCDIAGNLIVQSTSDGVANTFALGINVGGSATFITGGTNDLLRLNEDGSVARNLVASLGEGNNTYQQGSGIGPVGNFDINGSLTLITGNGTDNFQMGNLGAFVGGNVSILAGDGANTYNLAAGLFVGGSLTVRGGNGADNMGTAAAFIGGHEYLYLGNGANSVSLAGFVGGDTYYGQIGNGGGGVDVVVLNGNYNRFRGYFGAGDDSFTYGAGSSLTDFYGDFGAGADTYDDTLVAPVSWSVYLVNL